MSLSKSIISIASVASILILGLVYLNSLLAYEVTETITISADKSVYYLRGFIGPLHSTAFLLQAESIEKVVLNSTGGFVWNAESISYYIRKNSLTTVVEENSICYSACVLLFQAGKKRIAHVNSRFMIHSVKFLLGDTTFSDPVGTLLYKSLLRIYGFSDELIDNISVGKGDFYFDAVTAKEYGLVTDLVLD